MVAEMSYLYYIFCPPWCVGLPYIATFHPTSRFLVGIRYTDAVPALERCASWHPTCGLSAFQATCLFPGLQSNCLGLGGCQRKRDSSGSFGCQRILLSDFFSQNFPLRETQQAIGIKLLPGSPLFLVMSSLRSPLHLLAHVRFLPFEYGSCGPRPKPSILFDRESAEETSWVPDCRRYDPSGLLRALIAMR
ncbi:hypothetical protein FB451DRAFT_1216448 [Mycena latifolia]|nr:hypothetical protein FB451DRAFT_1216448 [Mycena latifolia]